MLNQSIWLAWLQQEGKDCQEFRFTKLVQVRQSRHSLLVKDLSSVRIKLSKANLAMSRGNTRMVNSHWVLITSSSTWTLNADFNTDIPKMTACVKLSAVFQHCVRSFQPSSKSLRTSQASLFQGGKCNKGEARDTMIDIFLCSDVQMSISDTSRECAKAWVKHKPHVPFHPQICIVPCIDSHIFSNRVSTGTDNQVSCKVSMKVQPNPKLPVHPTIWLSIW